MRLKTSFIYPYMRLDLSTNNRYLFRLLNDYLIKPKHRSQNANRFRFRFQLTDCTGIMKNGRADPVETDSETLKLRCWLEKVRTRIDFKNGLVETDVVLPSELTPEALFDLMIVQPLRYILAYRNLFTIHACAVTKGKNSIIIAGPSRAGKSALALSLVKIGYQLLADDLVILKKIGRDIHLLPFPKRPKVPPPLKSTICHPRSAIWNYSTVRPGLILFPRYQQNSQPGLKSLGRKMVWTNLINDPNNYLGKSLSPLTQRSLTRHDIILAQLVRQVAGYLITYHDEALRSIVPGMIDLLLDRRNQSK